MPSRDLDRPRGGGRRLSGFSLTDLLVSMLVIAILIAVLLPVLSMVYESARRVKCQSNLKQIGYALTLYADDHEGLLPRSHWEDMPIGNGQTYDRPENTIFVRHGMLGNAPSGNEDIWDGLGILVRPNGEQYLTHPGVLYCPSHHGDHDADNYTSEWAQTDGLIAGNYQYRLPGGASLFELPRSTTLVSDAIRSKSDYNHRVGNNMLKADISVAWFDDADRNLYELLAENGDDYRSAGEAVRTGWTLMDIENTPRNGGGGPAPGPGHTDPSHTRAGHHDVPW